MTPEPQIGAVTAALQSILGDGLLAVYLHGSAASDALRPRSDIDLLAVTGRRLTGKECADLLTTLLRLSPRHPARPGGPRCIELLLFHRPELTAARFPIRAEFLYGEWLRDGFEAGEDPLPGTDPEHALILAQARQTAIPLLGPARDAGLPAIPPSQIRHAMRALLPALWHGLRGDERNTLLTLARMWYTARSGDFASKDAAADWAIPQLPAPEAATLAFARRAYLGEVADDWTDRQEDALRLAGALRDRIAASL